METCTRQWAPAMEDAKMRIGMACAGNACSSPALVSLAAAAFVSLALSSLAAYLCLIFAGAGEAAASPGLTYFAPLWAYPELVQMSAAAQSRYINWATIFMFVYYCVYGLGLSAARLQSRGRIGLIALFAFHYAGFAVCLTSPAWDGIRNIWIVSRLYGPWLSVVLVEYFVLLHLLAIQYASSEMPYRPRMTRHMAIVLCVGLAVGFGFHLLAMLQVPQQAVG